MDSENGRSSRDNSAYTVMVVAEWWRQALSMGETEKEGDVARIRARLRSLEAERVKLENKLSELQRRPAQFAFLDNLSTGANHPAVTATSSISDKVALFRLLFAGRSDIFPIRWDNRKTGKAGYTSCLCQRMGERGMRQAAGQVRGMPASGVCPRFGRGDRETSSRRRQSATFRQRLRRGRLSVTAG